MSDQNRDIEELLRGADLNVSPDSQRMQSVQACLLGTAPAARPRRHAGRVVGLSAMLLVGAATAGLAGTQAGRNWVRQMITPIYRTEAVVVPGPPDPNAPGASSAMMVIRGGPGGDAQPFTPEEQAAIKAELTEVQQIQQAGGGRLVGLSETISPDGSAKTYTVFRIEYTLASGKKTTVGEGKRPLAGLDVDELMQLRDSGAGEVISSKPFPIGMGSYTIRFTLADGTTIDVEANYPPGTRAEREAIFAETRQLKAAGRFAVEDAHTRPDGGVWGLLRYTLADGRQVGIVETVPPEVIAPDGKSVITTQSDQAAQPGQ